MYRSISRVLFSLIDLLLYSNVWIAACATALCWQTQLLLSGSFRVQPLGIFIFFATLLLYALHRLVGLKKATGFKEKGRYFVIERFQLHIGIYALLAGLATIWFAWQLPWNIWQWIFPGIFISVGYVLPVFSRGRRLRDFHYIKIFLVSGAWAWITVVIPAVELHLHHYIPLVFFFLERMCFIFAIALPFDIRDLEMDRSNAVKTMPSVIGIKRSKSLAYLALVLSSLSGGMAYRMDAYSFWTFTGFLTSLMITAIVIGYVKPERHDYYFSGLLDGMMLIQFLLVWVGYQMPFY